MPENSIRQEDANAGRHLLKQLTQQQQRRLNMAVLLGLLASIFMIVQWYALAKISYLIIIEKQPLTEQASWIAMLISSLVLRSVFIRGQEQASQQASLQARQALRHRILQSWQQTSALIHQQRSPGAAASQLMEDVEAMDGYFSRFWPQQMLAVMTPLLIVVVVCYYNWLAALFLVLAAPLIPLFMVLVGLGAESVSQRFFLQRQRLAGHFLDRVKHLTTLKLFAAQTAALNEVQQRSDDYRKVVMKTLKLAFLSSAVLEFFTSVAIATMAIYIGFALLGSISWGPAASITLFSGLFILLLAPEFFQPLRNLSQFYHDRAAALAAATQIDAHLANPFQEKHQPIESTDKSVTTSAQSRLLVSELRIGYPDAKALQGPLTFQLSTGQCLVITGPSGAGKTTLLHTLAGYLPPQQGTLALNGQPMANTPIRYLPQKPWIIDGTWAENLAVLAPEASRESMVRVLNQLGLDKLIINRNNGLDEKLNSHGEGVSGGQLQRLALARVLLSPAPVILLDEPTASLDAESRRYVIAALETLKPDCMLIISSHDHALIKLADQQLDFHESRAN